MMDGECSSRLIFLKTFILSANDTIQISVYVYSLWSVDRQPVDQPPAHDQVVGREVQQICEDVAQVVRL